MPPISTLSHAHTSWVHQLRRSLLVRSTLYALLFMLLACFGDQRHATESPDRLAAASSEAPWPAEGPDGEILDASEFPDRCHGLGPGQAVLQQSPARIPLPAITALSLTDTAGASAQEPSGAVRRLLPSGGRSALTAICRWRI